uniref:Kinesin family member 15 n=1 Tax=Sphenodon punctatus TaxID=8508 RepID=A0A8D0H0F5_SPHPU
MPLCVNFKSYRPGIRASESSISQMDCCIAEGDAIKVYVRVRPPSRGPGCDDGDQSLCLSVLSSNTLRLHSKPEPKIFTFDHVADVETTQESVFSSVAKSIVESCMSGYNGTIFCLNLLNIYFSLYTNESSLGPPDSDNFTHNLRGVIPRSFEYLFFLIEREKEKAGTGKSFLCKCSFIEIYNEHIFDLLDSASAGLLLREHIKKGVFVVGAVEQVLTSAAEAYQVLTMGWRNRRVASTSMNRESSRSHAVFTITVESMEKSNEIVNIRSSLLNLVDLAGSERQKDTHTEGVRLKEAGNINRSLSCLGQVITALVDVGNGKQRHICYRDSKLTFLLRDSLGGNAKTCIIANVHPGSRCFGETLSTLNFAQRAKLIKNKAIVNEDTQGNVSQLQAEVKKLKEQLAQLALGQVPHDISPSRVSKGEENTNYRNHFLEAMLFLEKSESEKKTLLEKVAQLEDLCVKKERFIQSNKMIVKFREDHIVRLEKLHKETRGSLLPSEQDDLLNELREELRTLKEQMEQHPRVAKYAMENHSLREENKRLRSIQSVKRAHEVDAQTVAELEKAFLEASAKEQVAPLGEEPPHQLNNSLASVERLKARLLHTQSELTSSKQEYEEFKELTKKKHLELESELQSLQKANQHLENILEATKAHKRQEVSQLNKMHREAIKSITTPTKAYQLRSRLVPRVSPEILSQDSIDIQSSGEIVDDIFNEPVPPEMSEQAYEAISEELKVVQEQLSNLQVKLDEEESKNVKLQQHISKLEHHSTQMQELFSSERHDWQNEQQELLAKQKSLEKQLQDTQSKTNVLNSEVHDLRIVLQSADKELSAVKKEYATFREKQEKEMSELSIRHMNVQLQLDNVKLEYEQILEGKTSLQDDYENLQEVIKFETDQLKQQLKDSKEESEALKTELHNLLELFEMEKEHNQKLMLQLQEDKENNSKKLVCSVKPKVMCFSPLLQEVVADQMSQIQELRISISHKTEAIDGLTRELEDINFKYNSALATKEESKAILEDQNRQIEELREALERRQVADNIERELLCEDLNHTTEQLSKLTEASKKHAALLQSAQEDLVKKETLIQELQEQVNGFSLPSSPGVFLNGNWIEKERTLSCRFQLSSPWPPPFSKFSWLLCGKKSVFYQMGKLEEIKNSLKCKETTYLEMVLELERTRALETKTFQEREELRSKLEEIFEEKEKIEKETSVLRKQVEFLAVENGKLVGHQNLNQKIQYLVKLKKDHAKLTEEAEKLRTENIYLKEKYEPCPEC